MKNSTRITVLLISILLITSCNNEANNNSGSDSTQTASTDDHKHTYRCPMDCEKGKTYNEPGKCPVCGMELEHYDGVDNGLTYKMLYASNPAQLSAGQAATLSFTPKVVGKENESVALDLQHEKKIHLIIVSNDLSYFEHIHPEYQSDGSYQIKVLGKGQPYNDGPGKNETTFENGGSYFLFADYKPTGGSHQVEKVQFKINGPAKTSVSFTNQKLSGSSGNYTVNLSVIGDKFITGATLHMTGTVFKDGKQIDASSLENYLGAKAHMVVLSLDEKEYLHVHPDVANGKFDLHPTFKKPGIYRGWIQFQADGKIHTTDFTLNVVQGSADDIKKASDDHGKSTDAHSAH